MNDIVEIANHIGDNDKCLEILTETVMSYSDNKITIEVTRNIATGLIKDLTLTTKEKFIVQWYEKKINNFYISILNNIIIRRNRIINHECSSPRDVEDFKDIGELINKLNLLIKNIELIIDNKEEYNINVDGKSISLKIRDEIKTKVELIKKQLEIDIVILPAYTNGAKAEDTQNEELKAKYDIEMTAYLAAKTQYDSRSKIERFISHLKGKEHESSLKEPEKPQTSSYYYGPKLGGLPMYDIVKQYGRSVFSEQELFAIDVCNRKSKGTSSKEKEEIDEYLIWGFDYPTHYSDVYEEVKKGKGSK